MGAIESKQLEDVFLHSGQAIPISHLIKVALSHSDEELRGDALDLVCVGKKTSEVPSRFEIDMMKYYLWANMKCSSQSLRQSMAPKIGKFLQRLKDCIYAERKKKKSDLARQEKMKEKDSVNVSEGLKAAIYETSV